MPTIIDIDALAVMSDEELADRFRSLDDDRQAVINEHSLDAARPWEEELAYVRREQMIRRARHEAHERYLDSIEDDYSDTEASLPVADLDNSSFLELIN